MDTLWRAVVLLIVVGLPLALPMSTRGHAIPFIPIETAEDFAQHQLFVKCQPIWANIQEPSPEAQEVGLTKHMLENLVKSRLRASGIYADPTKTGNSTKVSGWIEVEVRSVGEITNVRMVFVKFLYDAFSGLTGPSDTWAHNQPLLTRQGDPEVLLGLTRFMLELFLKAFFDVNQVAC